MLAYYENSAYMDPNWWTPTFWALNSFQIAISAAIITHSIFINWGSKSYTFVRGCAEIAASTGFFMGVLTIICNRFPTPAVMSLVYDVLVSSGCSFFVQVCDNFIVLERAKAIQNIPRWLDWLIQAYIWLVLFVPWWPVYWLIPFFCNVNSPNMLQFKHVGDKICGSGNVIFNVYFSSSFAYTLFSVSSKCSSSNKTQTRKIQIIAVKSILHCCSSCFANIWADFVQLPDPSTGWTIYSIIIIVGLHFIFNFKIEDVFFADSRKLPHTSGQTGVRGSTAVHNNNSERPKQVIVRTNLVDNANLIHVAEV